MDRISVAEAARDFSALVDRIYSEGTSVELERDEQTIAYLSAARPLSALKVRDLTAFLQALPKLGDDAEAFSEDIRAIRRELPVEADPWD
jgi:antitoxin (DNA-binding transcriptional repressor) of toxin-antitoxin stability system